MRRRSFLKWLAAVPLMPELLARMPRAQGNGLTLHGVPLHFDDEQPWKNIHYFVPFDRIEKQYTWNDKEMEESLHRAMKNLYEKCSRGRDYPKVFIKDGVLYHE